ncbi:hypothetical protein WUBG_12471, partial [Wuchereria bancrofti]
RSSVLEYDEISNWSYQDIASEEQLDTVTASEGALLNLKFPCKCREIITDKR